MEVCPIAGTMSWSLGSGDAVDNSCGCLKVLTQSLRRTEDILGVSSLLAVLQGTGSVVSARIRE